MYFVPLQGLLLSCSLALHVRGKDVMDGRRFRLIEDIVVLGQVDIEVAQVAEFVKID